MWGYEGGSNEHYGALEVVEGNDPKYIYGQSFGYGDILEKGKIPNNMFIQTLRLEKLIKRERGQAQLKVILSTVTLFV